LIKRLQYRNSLYRSTVSSLPCCISSLHRYNETARDIIVRNDRFSDYPCNCDHFTFYAHLFRSQYFEKTRKFKKEDFWSLICSREMKKLVDFLVDHPSFVRHANIFMIFEHFVSTSFRSEVRGFNEKVETWINSSRNKLQIDSCINESSRRSIPKFKQYFCQLHHLHRYLEIKILLFSFVL
jgi:hypothetical protein